MGYNKIYHHEYYMKHRVEKSSQRKEFYRLHRAEILMRNKKYRMEHKTLLAERGRAKYLENKPKIQKYIKANLRKIVERNKVWAHKNKDKIKVYNGRAYDRMKQNGYYNTEAMKKSRKKYKLKNLYGITEAELEAIVLAQGGRCSICGVTFSDKIRPGVDHNHKTGEHRGVLCLKCNSGIGFFNESISSLHKAISYLVEWERPK